jgi:hypothetical protein
MIICEKKLLRLALECRIEFMWNIELPKHDKTILKKSLCFCTITSLFHSIVFISVILMQNVIFTSAGTAYVLILCRFFSPYRAEKILSRH